MAQDHAALCPVSRLAKAAYSVKLHAKVPDQVGVLDAFKYFQLICCLLDSFMVIRLKSNLEKESYSYYRSDMPVQGI